MIFGCFAMAKVISSPIIGKLMPYVGFKNVFITGTLLVTIGNITFGFLPLLEDRNLFIAGCFICRVAMGVGLIAINNALFVLSVLIWPEDIAFRLGTIETAVSLGSMIGPVFASVAHGGRYYLPFLILGLLCLIPGAISVITIPTGTSASKSSGPVSILSLLKSPWILLMCEVSILCASLPLMPEPLLSPHLQPQFDLNLPTLGAVFLIMPLFYMIFSPVMGKITGVWKEGALLLIIIGMYPANSHNSYFRYQSIVSLVLLRGHNSYHAYWVWDFFSVPRYHVYTTKGIPGFIFVSRPFFDRKPTLPP